MDKNQCFECGANLENVQSCRDYLNEMIAWDFQDFAGVGQIHHLTVLSYNLQHPSVYSKKGLQNAINSLKVFITNPTSFTEHDSLNRKNLSSDVRDWKITGTENDHGIYKTQPIWGITADDVVHGGLDKYVENVKKWSISILEILNKSGNMKVE